MTARGVLFLGAADGDQTGPDGCMGARQNVHGQEGERQRRCQGRRPVPAYGQDFLLIPGPFGFSGRSGVCSLVAGPASRRGALEEGPPRRIDHAAAPRMSPLEVAGGANLYPFRGLTVPFHPARTRTVGFAMTGPLTTPPSAPMTTAAWTWISASTSPSMKQLRGRRRSLLPTRVASRDMSGPAGAAAGDPGGRRRAKTISGEPARGGRRRAWPVPPLTAERSPWGSLFASGALRIPGAAPAGHSYRGAGNAGSKAGSSAATELFHRGRRWRARSTSRRRVVIGGRTASSRGRSWRAPYGSRAGVEGNRPGHGTG